jgi:hypothetical protein
MAVFVLQTLGLISCLGLLSLEQAEKRELPKHTETALPPRHGVIPVATSLNSA